MRAILVHLEAQGLTDLKSAAAKALSAALAKEVRLPRRDGSPGPLIRRARLLVRREKGVMRVHPTRNIHAELGPGSNHHLAIYRDGDEVRFLVVTKREAAERVRQGDGAVRPTHPGGGALVMALHPNDVLRRRVNGRDEFALIRFSEGDGNTRYKSLTMAGQPERRLAKVATGWVREGWRKVAVDPIGRVLEAR